MYALWLKIHWSCTLLTIMYAVWTNIYIVMYVAVSHVRSNVKQSPIKSCPPCCFFYVFDVFPAQRGALATLWKRKKAIKGSGLNMIKPKTLIIMYVSFYNHVRREDKHLCYHVRCWPSCTLFGQISLLACTLLSVMYVAMSNKIRLKSAPLLLFYVFLCFPSAAKGPYSARKT